MQLDMVEYAEALEEFLLGMEKVDKISHPGIAAAMDRICKLLRIAKVEITLYENVREAEQGKGEKVLFWQGEEADEGRQITRREVTGGQGVVDYHVFQRIKDADWTEQEREKIQNLIKMLFVFNGRSRVMQIAENLTYKDQGLDIYNLNYFMRAVNMLAASNRLTGYAAVYFNLDQFSVINQMVGRPAGTKIMQEYAKELQSLLGEDGIVCRIGGDNFITLFRKNCLEDVRLYLAGRNIECPGNAEERVTVSATGGCYLITDACREGNDVMDRVSSALRVAKMSKQNKFIFYDAKLAQMIEESKNVEIQFGDAIRNEEFKVYYQPKVLLKNYKLAGAEALCRWFQGDVMVPPYKFIPVLEQNRAICLLDFYMLEHVCKDIRQWLDEGREVVKVSVNLSRCHMGDVNLLQHLLHIVDRYKVPHEYIEIELTETTTDVDFKDLKEIVVGLRDEGISTAIDDFGVGYSSLNLLRELPWSVLKIDKSFLDMSESNAESGQVMLKHVIAMAQELGLECIVEGVETTNHIRMLKGNNCFLAQGFYFDKPLPKEEFEKRLPKRREKEIC